jgi:hypothetical protein
MLEEQSSEVGEILPVRIREDGDVDNETVILRQIDGAGDEIIWRSLGRDFTVRFKNSPFEDPGPFPVPAGGKKRSGPLRADASGKYDYEISALSLARSADPSLIVKP